MWSSYWANTARERIEKHNLAHLHSNNSISKMKREMARGPSLGSVSFEDELLFNWEAVESGGGTLMERGASEEGMSRGSQRKLHSHVTLSPEVTQLRYCIEL